MEDNEKTAVQTGEEDGGSAAEEAKVEAKKPEIKVEEQEVPRRNADYWKNETEREKTRQARAEFFKSKKKAVDAETGEELPDDEQPLTRAEAKAMMEDGRRQQELQDRDKSDAIEITSFLAKSENAKFQKYEAQARRYLKAHPYYPLSGVFRDLAYDDALTEGAQRATKAKDRNERGRFQGAERRPTGASAMPDFSGMKPSERAQALKDFKGKLRRGQASFSNADEE